MGDKNQPSAEPSSSPPPPPPPEVDESVIMWIERGAKPDVEKRERGNS